MILSVLLVVAGINVNLIFSHASNKIKSDVPQIYITTKEEITRSEYIPAEIRIVDVEGGSYRTIVDSSARIKIRGNSTALLAKSPYNIKLNTEESVLGMPAGKKWSMLANYLDTSLMRNKLSYDFAKDIGLAYSSESRYVDVWVNGKYNGNYLITVPVEAKKNRVEIDVDKGDYLLEISISRVEEGVTYINSRFHRFEINGPKNPNQEQMNILKKNLAEADNIISGGDYNKVKNLIDVDSFIDFYIIQEYFKNIDANTSSTRFYFKNGILYAGPLWDMDLVAGNVSTYPLYGNYLTYNNFGEYGNKSGNSYEGLWILTQEMEKHSWIGQLMKHSEFRDKVYNRYLELQDRIVNLYKTNSLGTSKMDILLKTYKSSFKRDNEKWPENSYRGSKLYRSDEKTFEESVDFLRTFLENRNNWLLENMIPKDFTTKAPEKIVKTASPTRATVFVDGKLISFDAYNIEGNNYFKLRDLAYVVKGSSKQFEVEWDEAIRAINLVSNTPYTTAGGELSKGSQGKINASLWTSDIYKDKKLVFLTAYNIKGNNYFKLRDVAKLFERL